MSDQHSAPRRPRRFAPLLIVAGLASAVVLSLSMTNTFSAFTAAITNSNDTAATGNVILTEVNTGGGGNTCVSSATTGATNGINTNTYSCSTINKYGGSATLVPGGTSTVNLSFSNTGTAPAVTFTLVASMCQQSANTAASLSGNATDLCSQVQVLVKSGATTIYSGTAAAMSTGTPAIAALPVPAIGTPTAISVMITLPTTLNNTYQGLAVSQPLTWTLST